VLLFIRIPGKCIILPLFFVWYISIIAFLVLCNKSKIKRKPILITLAIPVACIAAGIIIYYYYSKTEEIPIVPEKEIEYYSGKLVPFSDGNFLATLDEEPDLKIIDNIPVLSGEKALYPVYASFVQAVYPEHHNYRTADILLPYNYYFRNEYSAYEYLWEGKIDILFCMEPSETQLKYFNDNGITLKFIPIGKDALVFFVNENNTINNVSVEDIRGIYADKIKNWKKLNGQNRSIMAFHRWYYSESQKMLKRIMENELILKPQRVTDYKNFPNAIGYSLLFFLYREDEYDYLYTFPKGSEGIKMLSLNGVYPSKEAIQNNSYPFSFNFYAIYVDNDKKNKNIEPFIKWILSRQGQTLISKTGYISIKEE